MSPLLQDFIALSIVGLALAYLVVRFIGRPQKKAEPKVLVGSRLEQGLQKAQKLRRQGPG